MAVTKGRSIGLLITAVIVLGGFAYLMYGGIGNNLVYFLTPGELLAKADSVIGKPVRGGHYGLVPSLSALVEGDNLRHTTDFRRVYATATQGWLGYPHTRDLLGEDFEPFPMFG